MLSCSCTCLTLFGLCKVYVQFVGEIFFSVEADLKEVDVATFVTGRDFGGTELFLSDILDWDPEFVLFRPRM